MLAVLAVAQLNPEVLTRKVEYIHIKVHIKVNIHTVCVHMRDRRVSNGGGRCHVT